MQARYDLWIVALVAVVAAYVALVIAVRALATRGTAAARVADALRESERRFSTMLENVELISLMLDRNGTITYCNDYLLRLTGWQRHEVLGKSCFDVFVPPELVDELKGVFAELLDDLPTSWHHENEILTRSGERRLIRWNNSVLRSVTGDIHGTASIGEDITDRKSAERSIFERDEALETITSAVSEAIVMIDDAATIAYWNDGAGRLFGYSSQEALGRNLWSLLTPAFAEGHIELAKRTEEAGRDFAELRVQRQDGTELPVEMSSSTVSIRNAPHRVVVLRDISAHLRIQDSLHKALHEQSAATKLKDELVAVASHELRTPMSAIKGLSSMLLEGDFGSLAAEQREAIRDIQVSTERLIRLVNDMLDVHALESSQTEIHNVYVDIVAIAETIAKEMQPSAASKNLRLNVDVRTRENLALRADPSGLATALRNLVGNGIKFTDNGSVTIVISRVDSEVMVRVRDTGTGIPPEDQPHLFQKFQQIFDQRRGKPTGTGLGLYISRLNIEKAGGRLWLEKSIVGVGSVFAFALPAAAASAGTRTGADAAADWRNRRSSVMEESRKN